LTFHKPIPTGELKIGLEGGWVWSGLNPSRDPPVRKVKLFWKHLFLEKNAIFRKIQTISCEILKPRASLGFNPPQPVPT